MIRACACVCLLAVSAVALLAATNASPNRVRVTTASSREQDTTRVNVETATSMSQPMNDYIRSIAWWSLANLSSDAFNTSSRSLIENLFKKAKPVLSPEQRSVLLRKKKDYKPLIFAVASAAVLTRVQCKMQFQNERWNCPDTGRVQKGKDKNQPYYLRIVTETTRQTAFLTALSSAALMSSVMYLCNRGLNNFPCECDPSYRSGAVPISKLPADVRSRAKNTRGFEWGGCSDNVQFGSNFVHQFNRKPVSGSDQRFVANKHNREAGINVVERNIETQCQCHGVSGSCQARVCFRRQNQFKKIAEDLKAMYDKAKRVIMEHYYGREPNLLYRGGWDAPNITELVYTDEVQDDSFCNNNERFRTPGTSGRMCKVAEKTNFKESCKYLCCGRGFSSKIAVKQQPNQIKLAPNNEVISIPGEFVNYTRYECY